MMNHLKAALKETRMQRNIKARKVTAVVSLLLLVGSHFFFFGLTGGHAFLILITLVAWIGFFVVPFFILPYLYPSHDPEYSAIISGIEGEDKVHRLLSALPGFTVLPQVILPNPKSKVGTTEIDFVLIGQNSFFIIEVKNNRGYIFGNTDDPVLENITHHGTHSMRSPFFQAKIQQRVLRELLRKHSYINIEPYAHVVFSNPDAVVEIEDSCSDQTFLPYCHLNGALHPNPFSVLLEIDQYPSAMTGKSQQLIACINNNSLEDRYVDI